MTGSINRTMKQGQILARSIQMNIKDKIKSRLDALEDNLRAGKHLQSNEEKSGMESLIHNVSKFSSILSEGDRDFINAARFAVETNTPWK